MIDAGRKEVCTEKIIQLRCSLVFLWNWILTQVLVLICRPVKSHPVLSAQRNLGIQFHLECTYISLVYYDYQPAKEHIQKAQQLCGLNISLTGEHSDVPPESC